MSTVKRGARINGVDSTAGRKKRERREREREGFRCSILILKQ